MNPVNPNVFLFIPIVKSVDELSDSISEEFMEEVIEDIANKNIEKVTTTVLLENENEKSIYDIDDDEYGDVCSIL